MLSLASGPEIGCRIAKVTLTVSEKLTLLNKVSVIDHHQDAG
jgi:hypothetical protein